MKIPLNPPFSKGEVFLLPFVKGGGEGFKRAIFYIMEGFRFSVEILGVWLDRGAPRAEPVAPN